MRTRIGAVKATVATALVAAAFAGPAFMFVATSNVHGQSAATPQPVVGFWYITLTAEGNVSGPPDGTVIDWGLQQWHSDGTEILNSASGPKRFCLGMWVKGPGPSDYEINHFPLSYTDAGALQIINLREKVTLSRNRAAMTGTFTFDVYDDGGSLLQEIVGNVEGHRITMDSSVQDILPPTT